MLSDKEEKELREQLAARQRDITECVTALADERDKRKKCNAAWIKEYEQLQQQLAAERDSWDISPTIRQLREHLDGIREIIKNYDAAEDMPAVDALRDIEANLQEGK